MPDTSAIYQCDLWLQIDANGGIRLAKDKLGIISCDPRVQTVSLRILDGVREKAERLQEAKPVPRPLNELEEEDIMM